ncbi:hypothetical protein JCM9279_002379 [Rhodotorula babjevae]
MSTIQGGAQLANLLNAATAAPPSAVAVDPAAPPARSHAPPPPTATAPPGAAYGPQSKHVKAEDHYPSPPQGPPTPAATTSSPASFTIPLPSFVHDDPLSSDPDSSSDEDSFGQPKPARPTRFSKSTGLARPVPSYYYDAEYDPGTAGTKKRGRRGGYKGVPVFEPTMADFADNGGFYGYVKRIEKYGLRSGIVKVVPPKEWTDSLKPVDKPLRSIRLRDAIEQHMLGSQGLYRVMNEAKTRTWNAAQWKDLATRPKWSAPDLVGDEKKGERSERSVISDRARKRRASAVVDKKGKGKGQDGDESDEAGDAADEEGEEAAGSPKRRTPARRAKVDGAAKMAAAKANGRGRGAAAAAAVDEPSDEADHGAAVADPPVQSRRRRASIAPANPTDDEWAAFVAGLDELPHGMARDDYTVERLRDFERRYWRTLTFGEPPMYGADMAGSLFDESTTAWNVAHLGDLLPKLAPRGCDIPGVVSPYLYFGMWRATFAWHVEDADLYSINYIHFGAPKFWYSVPQEQSERFERVMAGLFPTDRSKCSQFLRHKSFLASPKILTNNGITLNRCVQLPGEFILTYPKGYHSGFNLGFNCAESVNFATERWLPLGKVTKHCQCIEDSVNIDVATWLRQAAKDEHLDRGEPWPYDELEEKALLAQIEAEERAEAERVERENAVLESAAALARKRAAMSASDRPVKKPKQQAAAAAAYQVPMVLMPAVPGVPPSGPLYTLSILQALQSNDVLAEVKAQLQQLIQHPSGTWRLDTPVRFQVVPHPNPPQPPLPAAPVSRTKVEPNPYAASAFHYPPQGTSRPPAGSSTSHASSSATPAPASTSASASASAPAAAPASTPLGRQPSAASATSTQQPQPVAPPKPEFACALCPDSSTEGLVKIGEPGVKSSRKRQDAHRVCVMFTPATWIEIDPESGEEIVRGFGKIEKARWKLKCQLCTESYGTKVQCTKGKCTKAFHVTCALREDSGIHLDATIPDLDGSGAPISILDLTRAATPPPAPLAENDVEPQPAVTAPPIDAAPPQAVDAAAEPTPTKPVPVGDQIQLTVLCRSHNPAWQRLETERKNKELRDKVEALQRGDRIRVRTNGGMYDVAFDTKNDDKETVEYVFEDGKRASVKWKLIIWPDSPEKQRKKEEAAARAEREKMAILDRPAYRAPAKRTTSAQAALAVPAVAPVPQPQPPHPAMQPFYAAAAAPPTAAPLSHAQAAHLQAYGYPSAPAPPAPVPSYGYPPQYQHHLQPPPPPPPHADYPSPRHPAPQLPMPTYPPHAQQGFPNPGRPPYASYAHPAGHAGPAPHPYASARAP